jgi:DTW domain-containing protein YfiP
MPREMCYVCRSPRSRCYCPAIRPMETRTEFVILMHPMEHRKERTGTGRLTNLCLRASRIIVGVGFDVNGVVRDLIADASRRSLLLYPSEDALEPSAEALREGDLPLRVFILDGTWACASKMYKSSAILQALPKLKIIPRHESRWLFKRQPAPACLSTLEAVHELLLGLEEWGLDSYPDKDQLLAHFMRLQRYQVESSGDPSRKHHRVEIRGKSLPR